MNILIQIGILAQTLKLVYTLEYQPKQLLYSSAFDQDQLEAIWDIGLRKNHDFENAQTISFGFWLKWSFVGPKLIEKQLEWHSICRLTTRENHTDYQDPQDRALSIWLSHDFYHFSTYTKEFPEKFFNLKYDQLDGQWNFLFYGYSYKENLARGYVVFSNNQVEEALIPAEHQSLNYLRFLIKREFNNPSFNGYYSNIFLQINEDYPLNKESLLTFLKSHQLISSLNFHQIFSQNILINNKLDTTYDKAELQQLEFDDVDSSEYSMSGWLKFTQPLELKDCNLIFRLSHLKTYSQGTFDKIFFLYSGEQGYDFDTYSCQPECSIVNWKIETNNNDNYWHFVYVAYSYELKKIFQFLKFDDRAFTIQKETIHHYQPHGVFINLQKDEYTAGYNGQMKRWTFNYGQGAYIETNFQKDLFLQAKIGIIGFDVQQESSIWKFEQSDLNINFDSDEDLQENEIDPSQSHFDTNEYGYGFWMKFLYSQGTRSALNLTLGAARFGTAQIYKDRSNLGESALSIYIKINEIIFETYSAVDQEIKQFEINLESDNEWLYIYTGYKRVYEETGQFLGCAYDNKGANTCISQYSNIVHYNIDNFLFFSVGSIGSKRKEIKHFSGQIEDIKLFFGKESILPKFTQIKQQQVIKQSIWITKQQESFSVDRLDQTPSEFKLEEFVSEYGVELWFKNLGTTEEAFQFVFLLATKLEGTQPENINLAAKLNQKQSIILQSHFIDSNLYVQELIQEIQLDHDQDKQQWTYLYFGYKKNQCQYFIQTKTNRFNDRLECKHFASDSFYLYKGYDGRQHNFLGDIDYLKVNFGQGAFQSQFHTQTEAFKQGLKLFPTSFEWKGYFDKIISIDSQKSALQQIFQSNNKISMNGQRNYGYGYWSRYLTEYPTLVKGSNHSSYISISSLFQNQNQNRDLEILSFYLSHDKQQYKIKTYDLETQKYKFGTFQLIKSQEGIWSYVYLSYSSDQKQVVGFLYQQQSNRVIRVRVQSVHHSSLNGKVNFILGQYQSYEGFNGQIAKLSLHFDGSSYKEDITSFKKLVEQSEIIQIPVQFKEFQFIAVSQQSENKEFQVHLEENYFPEEYTIYGWFRPDIESYDIRDNFQDSLLRLSSLQITEMEIPKFEFEITLTQNGIDIQTYSIEAASQPSSWVQNIPLKQNLGAWFYVCASYSQKLQRVVFHFQVVDNYEQRNFNEIQHYLANRLYLYLSDEKNDFAFRGQIAQIGLQIGLGSFYSKNEQLPQIELRSEHQIYQYKNYDGKFELINRLNIIEGKHELIGQTQYSVSLWVRWLHELKNDQDADADQNLLFRLARDIHYEDCSIQGDRIFLVYLAIHTYQFSTYNSLTQECSQQKQIYNTNFLEGQWNLLYFGYQNTQDFVGAKGFVYFSKNSIANQLEFDVEHFPLSATAALTLGQREYSFDRFYGQMHDVQVTIGYGFENDIESLKRRTTLPDPDLNSFNKHNLIGEEILMEKLENSQFMSKLNFEKQYALFGWFKFQGQTEFGKYSVLARVSNQQELKGALSDQTFLVLVNEHTIEFKSYTLEAQPQEGEQTNEINKPFDFIGKEQDAWVFFYIGYNFEENQLVVYIKYNDDLHQQQDIIQNVFHYLPLEFYIFIGQDNVYSKFTGFVDDINLLTGQSSYLEQNIYSKLGSLNRKYIEDVLH